VEDRFDEIRTLSRKGILEILRLLNLKGPLRFSRINKEIPKLCLASLTNALTLAKDFDLIEKAVYRITEDGNLQTIDEDDLKKGVKPEASLYKLKKKGKAVLKINEDLIDLLRST